MMNRKQRLEILCKFAIFEQENADMIKLKDINIAWVIHFFALLHAVVALVCRQAGFNDELFLTILTMTMVLLICMKKWISIEYAAACVIVANVSGYLLGHLGADLFQALQVTGYAANALATVFTTELLGWSIELATRLLHNKKEEKELKIFSSQMHWLIAAVCMIFVLRIALVMLFATEPFKDADILGASAMVFSNSAALMILIALNVLYIRLHENYIKAKFSKLNKVLIQTAFMLTVSIIEITLLGFSSPAGLRAAFTEDFPVLMTTSLLAEATVFCIVYMISYAMTARKEAQKAMGMANIAQYRYLKLKHQVNPHFLFNSLNILDCLVCEEKTEQASTYIHKLAELYRYMLKTEEEKLVSLRDELDFANQYYDLLKVRFPEGLKLEIDIQQESLNRYVVPCSLQLLIENATKHNSFNSSRPLTIYIKGSEDKVRVSNNISPKVSKGPSTGLGLKYMKQQYLDLSGKSVDIEHTDDSFCVTIPLL